jgi:hypothetical protein
LTVGKQRLDQLPSQRQLKLRDEIQRPNKYFWKNDVQSIEFPKKGDYERKEEQKSEAKNRLSIDVM